MANSSTQIPWSLLIPHENSTEDLRTIFAPTWTDSPNVRGSLDIIQSCVLTLVACIYTALHLDVPIKTSSRFIFLQKLKWVALTLFAPEIALFMAAYQLRQAWNLKSTLLKIRRKNRREDFELGRRGGSDANFEIDLRYAFFIIMGGLHFDVDEIMSESDMDTDWREHFTRRPFTARPSTQTIIWLAERGHWIKIQKKDIDDKSKADILQKCLVVIQVLWMVIQCISRKITNLPLTLLEVHTMVHVVCAVLFYVCWFKKPLNVQEPLVVKMGDFESEIALKVQQQFYSWACYHIALFEAPRSDYQDPPLGLDEKPMKWIMPEIGSKMYYGNILPSGVALYGHSTRHYGNGMQQPIPDHFSTYYYDGSGRQSSEFLCRDSSDSLDGSLLAPFIDRGHIEISEEFIRRWDSIFKAFPFENRRELSIVSPKVGLSDVDEPMRIPGVLPSDGEPLPLYLSRLDEFVPQNDTDTFSELPFTNRGGNLDFKTLKDEEKSYGFYLLFCARLFTLLNTPWVPVSAMVMSAIYGGVHLSAWNWMFPTSAEKLAWKISCLTVACALPVFFFGIGVALFITFEVYSTNTKDVLASRYFKMSLGVFGMLVVASCGARVFIIVESFMSIRKVPIGVFISPTWIQMVPHF
ncbi:Hypothetical protein NCS54_01320000 [Fusarium falciforme]|uniref:Hypothetical protein n=1 Tax=Fusarium falciforme TaxID=195108 RepID=UPI0023012E72|nr:Hypothetical protein NCS54_01320000 [Fusarium falciforme]WAO95571.1 Hypothetical protein NCS54_01320000 [Fusarium falciforme]